MGWRELLRGLSGHHGRPRTQVLWGTLRIDVWLQKQQFTRKRLKIQDGIVRKFVKGAAPVKETSAPLVIEEPLQGSAMLLCCVSSFAQTCVTDRPFLKPHSFLKYSYRKEAGIGKV